MFDLTPIIPVVVALIVATPGFLAWRQSRKNKDVLKEVKGAVSEVHVLVNSRLDQLLKLSKAKSKRLGVAEGKAQQKKLRK